MSAQQKGKNEDQKNTPNPKASGDARAKKSFTAEREEQILEFWKEKNVFEKSLAKEQDEKALDEDRGKEFVFYDGPPFATGLPHYGSLLSSIIKDVIPRYKTMRGFYVRRRWGWDCHGLPIENMIEKELDLADKTEIEEKVGVAAFNKACRESVLRYADEWKKYIDRVGRWVEYDNAYKTMDNTYIESVWWALHKMNEEGLLYEGRKVLLYCPHCETPIAKAEVQMDNSYEDVTEEAVTAKFKTADNKYLLAWTTTPWTLPGNVALAVHNDITYVEVESEEGRYILAEERVEEVMGDREYKIVKEMKGSELVGLEYEPLYKIDAVGETGKKAWYVTSADFVTIEEGTGVVHTAVIYGEDDYELGVREDLPMLPLLDSKGHFTDKAPEFIQEKYFKGAEKLIKNDLEERALLFDKKNHTHSYPHCHRCGTALLYNAITSWFLNIGKVKDRLVDNNENINWVPDHLKHGRFLNIVENAPDWTISRNRYWASPLPIWKCDSCDELEVVGSLEKLKEKTESTNTFYIMRHGESDGNVKNIVDSRVDAPIHLTEKGKEQVHEAAQELKKKKIDLVVSSPFVRMKETAEILREELDVEVVFEDKLGEIQMGEFDGKSIDEYHAFFENMEEMFTKTPEGGESFNDVKRRMGEVLRKIEKEHEGKHILILSHSGPLWTLFAAAEGLTPQEAARLRSKNKDNFIHNAEVKELPYARLPVNEDFELDLHRPYIDDTSWGCVKCDGEMVRIPEVLDGWVESASMPFAEYHYPFENQEDFEKRSPGDFVAEYIAQTRTWFYYMHAVSTMLFDREAFRNVVSTGTILAEDGSKMSKSKGNYTDPFENLHEYGADALRYYLMTSVVMQGEDLRFKDGEIREAHNRFINILWNVVRFFRIYTEENEESGSKDQESKHVLDRWIIARLKELHGEVTEHLDAFDTVRAGRPIRDFIDDFSTWYLRRSRDRFKGEDEDDRNNAITTTRYVLQELSKIIAPFTPFLAESVWQEVKDARAEESIHLASWPDLDAPDDDECELVERMREVREVVSKALEKRDVAGIRVRQPLSTLRVKNQESGIMKHDDLLTLVRDEVNVKEVIVDKDISDDVVLDTTMTDELKREGMAREFLRNVQSLRKKEGLEPSDEVTLFVETEEEGKRVIEEHQSEITRQANITDIVFEKTDADPFDVEEVSFAISIET